MSGEFSKFLNRAKPVVKEIGEDIANIGSKAAGLGLYESGFSTIARDSVKRFGSNGEAFGYSMLHNSMIPNKVGILASAASKMVEETEGDGLMKMITGHNYKLSGAGKMALLGGLAASGVSGGIQQNNIRNMGTVSQLTAPPPQMTYDYSELNEQSTGASGDLVLALNKLRKG